MTPTDQILTSFKTLWGASSLPFQTGAKPAFEHPVFEQLITRLAQLCATRSNGMLHGGNGVGKSYLISSLIKDHLPEKRFAPVVLTHATLSGSDLLRALCRKLGVVPKMRRSDNVAGIAAAWQELAPRWPILVLEEAQELSAVALEELRLLSCSQLDAASFSMLLVGDEGLPQKLQMGIFAPLRSRLGYCLRLSKLDPAQSRAYIVSRLKTCAIAGDVFAPEALELVVTSTGGNPRAINHLGQRSMELAAQRQSLEIKAEHVQESLDCLPWMAFDQSPHRES